MFDAKLRPLVDPPLNATAQMLVALGVGANTVTLLGLVVGLLGAGAISDGQFLLGLALILTNRVLDGLDGAIARATRPSDFGAYLDSVADFIFYAAVPLAFGLADPANTLPALVLVASFVLTGTSFLAFAAIAAKRGEATRKHGRKGFFYSTGLAEGAETILAFVLMAALPAWFPVLAYLFAALCLLTVFQRSVLAWKQFRR